MSATSPATPPGWVRLDNKGDPALIRAKSVVAVYKDGGTRVVLDCPTVAAPAPFFLFVTESVDDVGAALDAAVGG